jgi:hypothetical protein
VGLFITRLSAVALTLTLVAGNLAVCAAWADSPEARMDCCTDEDQCPMHASDSSQAAVRHVTQSDADSCCFMGNGSSQPSSSSQTFVPIVSLAPLPVQDAVALVRAAARAAVSQTLDVLQASHVPRHLLISVLLV